MSQNSSVLKKFNYSLVNFAGSVFVSCMVREMPFLHYVAIVRKYRLLIRLLGVSGCGNYAICDCSIAGAAEMPVFQYVAPFSGCTMQNIGVI